ncbi:MAG: peptidoglycan editing factor PgeF [Oscillospiraceae bacterium]|nr:peptidoglycan editing factor PgeF [Oscillospiraceae bacterium]
MEFHKNNGVEYLTFPSFSHLGFLNHAFSTRCGGVSQGEFASMNLSFGRGDPQDYVIANYQRFTEAAGFDFNSLVTSAQDHSANVKNVTDADKGIGSKKPPMHSVDAIITNKRGVTIVTYYADCTPLFFADPVTRSIGLAHAGWRGTVAQIAKKTVEKMAADFGTRPQDLVCAIGPCIGKCCYEVDDTVILKVTQIANIDKNGLFTNKGGGKYMLDLQETNRRILQSAGVLPQNIELANLCTKCNSSLLWSHRATGGKRGTMAAFMAIK